MTQEKKEQPTNCPMCKHKSLRFRTDKTFHCLKCGYDSRSDTK